LIFSRMVTGRRFVSPHPTQSQEQGGGKRPKQL
jgi:hypothetical protein